MDGFVDRLDRWATGRSLLVFAAMFLILTVLVFPAVVGRLETLSGGVGPLDVELSFTVREAYARIEAYGPEGRRLYALVEATIDVAFPLVTASLLSLTSLFLLRQARLDSRVLRRLSLVPAGALMADLLENTGLVVLLLAFPTRLDGIARATSFVVSAKWVLVGLAVATTASTALAALIRSVTGNEQA